MKNKTSNYIPRKFYQIKARCIIGTNAGSTNDILHIYKNDFGYLALNTKTGLYYYIPLATLRNKNVFEILEIDR